MSSSDSSPPRPPLPPPEVAVSEKPIVIRSVWARNLEYEFSLIQKLVDRYHFVSMDTEFPGIIFRQDFRYQNPVDHYKALKSNVDILKLIQVGITLTDSDGNLPDLGTHQRFIWEFNFSDFDVARDDHAPGSIELLRQQGFNFEETKTLGVGCTRFAELMMSSGLVCNDAVTYITFHGAHDFGYVIKALTGRALPSALDEFIHLMKIFFGGRVYDVKHLMKFCQGLHGGLDRVASTLEVGRAAGKCHQGGSDSLLTWHAFQRIREVYFNGNDELLGQYAGVLCGLEVISV